MPVSGRLIGRVLAVAAIAACAGYAFYCMHFYVTQQSRLFTPAPLPADHQYDFGRALEERSIPGADGTVSGLLLPVAASHGIVLFLPGATGNAADVIPDAVVPVAGAGYDLLAIDYPGFGKSTGSIRDEAELDAAMLAVYDWLMRQYPETRIILAGYDFGAAPAAWLGCRHHPQRLVLLAPGFSGFDTLHARYPLIPERLFRFPLRTDRELTACNPPVSIFHGANDDVVPPGASERLHALLKPTDTLALVGGAGHRDLLSNPDYQQTMQKLLTDGVQALAKPPKGVIIR